MEYQLENYEQWTEISLTDDEQAAALSPPTNPPPRSEGRIAMTINDKLDAFLYNSVARALAYWGELGGTTTDATIDVEEIARKSRASRIPGW